MRKLAVAGVLLLLLAACAASSAELSLRLTFSTNNETARTNLTKMSIAVIERRLARYGVELKDIRTETDGSGSILHLGLPAKELAEELTAELQSPYTFRLVKEDPAAGTGGLMVEGQGTFVETGITEKDLAGAEWAEDGDGGAVRLVFTEAGKVKLAQVAAETKDTVLGIVARGVFMSKTKGGSLTDEVVIRNIPTPEFAQVFADDVNVGLHVTFTPIP